MISDDQRQEAATILPPSRHPATSIDSDYSLSIEEVVARYEEAGLPRTARSIQRYCAKAHLDAHRIETPFGEKFLVSPASVDRHIAYIKELRPVATGHDLPRHAGAIVAGLNKSVEPRQAAATADDAARQTTTGTDLSRPAADIHRTTERYLTRLENENEFLRGQVAVKDKQIDALQERAHETNALINGLQRMLAPLLTKPERTHDTGTGDRSGGAVIH